MSKSYPQVLLFGDSILQQSSFLRDGYSFGAVLAERKTTPPTIFTSLSYVGCNPDTGIRGKCADRFIDCIRRFDVVNRGLVDFFDLTRVLER